MATRAGSGSFLFVTWPGGGNIHPLVALGRRLQERGHQVRVLAAEVLRTRFESEGLPFVADSDTDVVAEVALTPTDVAVVDYMDPKSLAACQGLDLPTVAYVHTLYQRVAIGPMSPMLMSGDADAVSLLGHCTLVM